MICCGAVGRVLGLGQRGALRRAQASFDPVSPPAFGRGRGRRAGFHCSCATTFCGGEFLLHQFRDDFFAGNQVDHGKVRNLYPRLAQQRK